MLQNLFHFVSLYRQSCSPDLFKRFDTSSIFEKQFLLVIDKSNLKIQRNLLNALLIIVGSRFNSDSHRLNVAFSTKQKVYK